MPTISETRWYGIQMEASLCRAISETSKASNASAPLHGGDLPTFAVAGRAGVNDGRKATLPPALGLPSAPACQTRHAAPNQGRSPRCAPTPQSPSRRPAIAAHRRFGGARILRAPEPSHADDPPVPPSPSRWPTPQQRLPQANLRHRATAQSGQREHLVKSPGIDARSPMLRIRPQRPGERTRLPPWGPSAGSSNPSGSRETLDVRNPKKR